jgi:hypothetical protein
MWADQAEEVMQYQAMVIGAQGLSTLQLGKNRIRVRKNNY